LTQLILFCSYNVTSSHCYAKCESEEWHHNEPSPFLPAKQAQANAIHHRQLCRTLKLSYLFLFNALGMTYVPIETSGAAYTEAANHPRCGSDPSPEIAHF